MNVRKNDNFLWEKYINDTILESMLVTGRNLLNISSNINYYVFYGGQ